MKTSAEGTPPGARRGGGGEGSATAVPYAWRGFFAGCVLNAHQICRKRQLPFAASRLSNPLRDNGGIP